MPDPGELGIFILDIDGTLMKHGTDEWLPGALELIEGLTTRGYEVAFVTRRGDREFSGHPVYGRASTKAALVAAGFGPNRIWFDVRSPRYLMDDSWAQVIEKETDEPVSYLEILAIIDKVDAERPA